MRGSTLQLKRWFSLDRRNRLSNKFIPLTKDKTSHSDLTSHSTLLKAGFIRQSGAGIYSLLPFGLKTIEKIEKIIDEEMQAIGSEKLSLPILLNPDHWKKTGRWDGAKGEFFRFKDRKESDLLLAPTHEEEITQLVANELRSARQLPLRLYQIGRKYRDELRPRAGLLRGREFVMKDLYSFDSSQENAFITYDQVGEAYRRIFQRIGVPFVVAEADSGNMGGSKSHEYHLISPVGEDTLLTCTGCGYTANQELAIGQYMENRDNNEDIGTNNHQFLSHIIPSARFNSTVVTFQYKNALDQGWAAILTPVGRSPNLLKVETQLNNYLTQQQQSPITIDMNKVSQAKLTTIDHTTIPHIHLFVDDAIQLPSLADTSRVTVHPSDHFRLAREGDLCTSCHQGTQLSSVKAIECGHTFYLGTRYSADLDCKFRDTDGAWKIAEMGCYGIGISRLLAAVAEACHDHRGLVWPRSIAPYRACIIAAGKEPQEETINKVYDALSQAYKGDIVIDDRPKIGFGAKMKDAELMGYPFIIVLGSKASAVGLKEDITVELHERIQNEGSRISMISFNELIKKI